MTFDASATWFVFDLTTFNVTRNEMHVQLADDLDGDKIITLTDIPPGDYEFIMSSPQAFAQFNVSNILFI